MKRTITHGEIIDPSMVLADAAYSGRKNHYTAGNLTRFSILVTLLFITAFSLSAQNFSLVGWATQSGGTTGGAGGDEVTVNTGTALQNAINNKGSNPLTIYVNGTINLSNSSGLSKIDVKDVSDVSIIGVGTSGELNGIGIKIWRSSNIIIRNLRIHHVMSGDKDCISIEGPSDHIWIDHNELYNQFQGVGKDDYDGLLDAKRDVYYVTYSWNYLHDSWKAMLSGSSESDTYNRTITIHHNYFRNINSRLPLFRSGQGHIFNNLYEDVAVGAINSRINACIRIENNYFSDVNDPWYSADSDVVGDVDESGNVITNGSSFDSDPTPPGSCNANIPYSYSSVLESASSVPSSVPSNVGVGVIDGGSGGGGGGGGSGDVYQLRNRGTGLYLDGMGVTTNGDPCGQYANTTHPNSRWELVDQGSGYFQLRNVGTGLYLDGMGRTTNGDDVGQWANTTHYNSHWQLQQYDGNYYRLQNRTSGLFLDGMGRTSNGANAGQWGNTTHPNAQWELINSSARVGGEEALSEPKSVLFYPNPVEDYLNIQLEENSGTAFAEIFNVSGQVVLKQNLPELKNQLKVADLPKGIYFLELTTDSGVTRSKLLKQ